MITRTAADPLSAVLALAEEIAQKSPDAIRAAKRLYDETWISNDPAAALALESELQTGLIGSPNQIAAVVAGMSWERPVFADPASREDVPDPEAFERLPSLASHRGVAPQLDIGPAGVAIAELPIGRRR